MNEWITLFAEASDSSWGWLVSAAVKSTVWLLLAGMVLRLWRSASASFRHGLAVAIAIGVAAIFVLNVSPIPGKSGWRPLAALVSLFSEVSSDMEGGSLVTGATISSGIESSELSSGSAEEVKGFVSPLAGQSGFAWLAVPVILWGLGCLLVGWRLLCRLRAGGRFSAGSASVIDAPDQILRWMHAEVRHLKIKRKRLPRVVMAENTMPMIVGLWRPVIVLPTEATEWSRQTAGSVLRHELLHFRRCDLWTALVVEIALVATWWHPLSRKLKKQIAELTEQACDDAVLDSGASPAEYAGDLLSLSRRFLSIRPPLHAMSVHPGSKGGQLARFHRVLDVKANRRPLSPLRVVVIAGLALALVVPGTLLVSCATSEAVEHLAETTADIANATHPSLKGVPKNAQQLRCIVKFYEIDITDDERFASDEMQAWINGGQTFLTPDVGFRLFHPQAQGLDILSAPTVVARPGQSAKIEVGSIVYTIPKMDESASAPVTDSTRSPDEIEATGEGIMTGVEMSIKAWPTVDANVIKVELKPSVAELLGYDVDEDGNQIPEVQVQEIDFHGDFPNGSYLSLGETSDQLTIEEKVPLLGSVPLLGRLFRSADTQERQKLIAVQVIFEGQK